MRTRYYILIAVIFIFFSGNVFSAEKSVIVGFHKKPGLAERALIHRAKGVVKHTYRHISAMSARLSEEAIADIRKNEHVAYVEDDGFFTAVEPEFDQEYADAWGVQHIGSEAAHTSGNKGTGVKIAVIDTGIDYTHEDLDDNYRGGYDFVFRDNDPYDDNRFSHGTHIAGIIAAEQNGIGVVGVAPEADLYAVKVLDGGGFGLLSWIIEGIEWAVDNQMDIANLSLEGPDSQSLRDACNAAYEAGLILVAAAGNNYGREVRYPAAYDSVIAVTGTDAYDMKAYFSPVGPEVEFAAPGLDILSTVAGGYDYLSGTSQAAPHVSGTAALYLTSDLLQDMNGDGIIGHEDVRLILRNTAIDLGDPGQDNIFGFGLVNAAEAAFPTYDPLFISISRTSGPPKANAETVFLSGPLYEITIENNGLSKVRVDVFEDGVYQKNLSSKYRFTQKNLCKYKKRIKQSKRCKREGPQEVTFFIDAVEKSYDVRFTPYGKHGSYADIFINPE